MTELRRAAGTSAAWRVVAGERVLRRRRGGRRRTDPGGRRTAPRRGTGRRCRARRRRVRLDGPDHPGLPPRRRRASPRAAASWCRPSTDAPSRRRPSPPRSGAGSPRRTRTCFVLRTSVGRYGETEILQRPDADLVGRLTARPRGGDRTDAGPRRDPRHPLGRRPAPVPRRPPRARGPRPRTRRQAARDSRCAARRTTGSGIPACIASAYAAVDALGPLRPTAPLERRPGAERARRSGRIGA